MNDFPITLTVTSSQASLLVQGLTAIQNQNVALITLINQAYFAAAPKAESTEPTNGDSNG